MHPILARAEFITMMTGQPYKSPETAAAKEEEEEEEASVAAPTTTSEEGNHTPTTTTSPASPSSTFSAAVRGVSTISARLQRQRLANQVYKDAWATIDPTLEGSITPGEVARVAAAVGLELTAEDVQELIDPDDERGAVVSCEYLIYLPKCLCVRGYVRCDR